MPERIMGYLPAHPEHELIDGSELPARSLVCMNCSLPLDDECYDDALIGEACSICGDPCEPHEED